MPSPIGHALAGIATVWTVTKPRSIQSDRRLLIAAACLAALPDIDLVHPDWHRAYTHSIGALLLVTIITVVVTGWVKEPVNRSEVPGSRFPGSAARTRSNVVLVCAAAYASHLLLDWLAADHFAPYGIRALWPFDDGWYISGLEIFRQTARLHLFTQATIVQNAEAIAQEIAILGPIVYVLWLVRVKPATRLASELPGVHHPAE